MKILILTDGIFPFVIGGMQKHSYYLAKQLLEQGERVTLVHCVPFGKQVPTSDEVFKLMSWEEREGFESIVLPFPKAGVIPGHYLKESYLYSKRIYELLKPRLNEFDFIYAKGFTAWHFLYEKQKGKSIPPVGVNFHGYEMFQPSPSFKENLKALLMKSPVKWNNLYADYVFSYGAKITDIIRDIGVVNNKIIEIPTGIESSWLSDCISNFEKINFVFIGRYERRKGIEELNEALRALFPVADFTFHFIGPIPLSKRLVNSKVVYHGVIMEADGIKKILDKCQVLVIPSHSEGMPNVIMEGMARGLAVLTTPVGAVETVVDESNGWLVAPGSKEELRKVMEEIVQAAPKTIRAKQESSRQKIVSFLWESIAKQTRACMANTLGHFNFTDR